MNYLLKIVQGANAGAEIALAEGVVTFGSSDACDIVLADASLPDEAFAIETSDAGVSVRALPDGEAKNVELYTLFTFGNSSFAIGENGVAWPEVKAPAPPPPPEQPAEVPDAEAESSAPMLFSTRWNTGSTFHSMIAMISSISPASLSPGRSSAPPRPAAPTPPRTGTIASSAGIRA